MAQSVAEADLQKAEAALKKAEALKPNSRNLDAIRHDAFMAERHAKIGTAKIAEAKARASIDDAELQRSQVVRQARERETADAQALAASRGAEAELANRQAEAAADRADAATSRANELQEELEDLQAKETERGLILTLGDVLFDTNKADLKPGAGKTISRIAEFLNSQPDRRLLIEGHTDDRGTDSYNMLLSERRANSVRDALIGQGVRADRIRATGLGESYPVATNDSVAGRQENRRVEVVIATEGEQDFPSAVKASTQ